MTQTKMLQLEKRANGVAVAFFDAPGETVNTLRGSFAAEFAQVFDEVERDTSISCLILASKKSDNFIAGADISMLQAVQSADEAAELSRVGQGATNRIAACRVPVVAAIHGACLGGGLEIALACKARVASNHSKTKLGLPEVQLGILPGMGGTVRLVPVVGLSLALDLLLTGRQLDARRAQKAGLVDEVVAPEQVLAAATSVAQKLVAAQSEQKDPWASLRGALDPEVLREIALAENPLGRKVVFDQARKRLLSKTKGNYPAPLQILDVVRVGLEKGASRGLDAEALAFGRLVVSEEAAALRHIYFSQTSLKKDDGAGPEVSVSEVEQVGVLGAGLMGIGISEVSLLQANANVRLKDVKAEGLASALGRLQKELDERVSKRRLTRYEAKSKMMRLTSTTDYSGFARCQVVIEAVFEDLALKRQVLTDVEQFAGENTIFASNTSALPITAIAAAARRPELVIGMHYFSPVPKMPLLEIITTEKTAPWVVKTCVQLGKRQGKTVIVVADGPGFYTTRILAPYLNEAAFCVLEGQRIEDVDKQLIQVGFPVGPLALLDEVGIDVGSKVAKVLAQEIGGRLAAPPALAGLLEHGRLGRKNEKGFYDYQFTGTGKRPADVSVYADMGLDVPNHPSSPAVGLEEPGSAAERCLLAMVNEAAHCMTDGILRNERDGDIGAVFGLGFPPFLGGPFHFIKTRGAREIVGRLERLQRDFGPRFAPADYLRSL